MHREYNIRKQFDLFDKDDWSIDPRCFYFYDWFCKSKSLRNKAESLMTKARKFVKLKNIDMDKNYIWFKNNCPCVGSLYDDFRIASCGTGDVLYTVVPRSGHNGLCEIWGQENDFKEPILEAKNWTDALHKLKKTVD